MAVTREEFERGMTYDEYKAQMTRNQEQFEANEKNLEIKPEDLQALKSLPQPVNVLAIGEDWCGDVIANLPILGRLAKESGTLNLKVLLRDQNLDVMNRYLLKGEFQSIPVFVFLDQDFREIGYFQERPDSVTEERARRMAKIFADHPEFGKPGTPPNEIPEAVRPQYMAASAQMRQETGPWANQEVVKAIRQILEPVAAGR